MLSTVWICMANDWFPTRLDALDTWAQVLNTEANNYKTTFPTILTVTVLTQTLGNSQMISTLRAAATQGDNYRKDANHFGKLWIKGHLGGTAPVVPVVPTAISVAANSVFGLEAFYRQLAGQIKRHPAYTKTIGISMGIEPGAASLGQPKIRSVKAQGGSHVKLEVTKAGYDAVAVDSKRGAGDWEQIGVSLVRTFVDARPPLVAGVSEVRQYRIQGMEGNVRTGTISQILQIATTP